MEHIPVITIDGLTLNDAQAMAVNAAVRATAPELTAALETPDLDTAAVEALTQMKNRTFEVLKILRGETTDA
jgi:hypothetical protein